MYPFWRQYGTQHTTETTHPDKLIGCGTWEFTIANSIFDGRDFISQLSSYSSCCSDAVMGLIISQLVLQHLHNDQSPWITMYPTRTSCFFPILSRYSWRSVRVKALASVLWTILQVYQRLVPCNPYMLVPVRYPEVSTHPRSQPKVYLA